VEDLGFLGQPHRGLSVDRSSLLHRRGRFGPGLRALVANSKDQANGTGQDQAGMMHAGIGIRELYQVREERAPASIKSVLGSRPLPA
jgi:hypothetical protein